MLTYIQTYLIQQLSVYNLKVKKKAEKSVCTVTRESKSAIC